MGKEPLQSNTQKKKLVIQTQGFYKIDNNVNKMPNQLGVHPTLNPAWHVTRILTYIWHYFFLGRLGGCEINDVIISGSTTTLPRGAWVIACRIRTGFDIVLHWVVVAKSFIKMIIKRAFSIFLGPLSPLHTIEVFSYFGLLSRQIHLINIQFD